MSKTFPVRFACAAALLASGAAAAGQADICYGPDQPLSDFSAPSNATVFNCPQAGKLTVPQLAEAGWSIVQMVPVTTSGSTQAIQLVIQKP